MATASRSEPKVIQRRLLGFLGLNTKSSLVESFVNSLKACLPTPKNRTRSGFRRL